MPSGRKTLILIADDSAVIRTLLRTVVAAAPNLEVVGTAADGESALNAVEILRPDLLLLDVEMPVLNGLNTLRKLRARGHRLPVIMCSSLTQRGAKVTIEALASGASDYVAKPSNQTSRDAAVQSLRQELIPKIHALTTATQPYPLSAGGLVFPPGPASVRPEASRPSVLVPFPMSAPLPRAQAITSTPTVVVIGVSTGGPAALDQSLPNIPANFPLPILIVQHMPELFTKLFAERLNGRCHIPVNEASEGAPIQPGTIMIARGGSHLEILPSSRSGLPPTAHLTQAPPENHCRPAVDVLFRSVVPIWGSGVLAVVLTGMGSDGCIGCRIIREHGGSVLAQNQATSAVWGMPGAVTNAGLAHRVLPLNAIVPEILRLTSRSLAEASQLREAVI
jgi:two-component system chemotaxis response regulator CheB